MAEHCSHHSTYTPGCDDCKAEKREAYWAIRDKRLAWRHQNYRQNRRRILEVRRKWLTTPKGRAVMDSYKEYLRWFHLVRAYGLTRERFLELLVEQKGLCAMCERKLVTIYVDHDHKTKRVRALVCPRCNTLLGLAKDDRGLLRAAIDYLTRHSVEVIPDEPANGPLAQP